MEKYYFQSEDDEIAYTENHFQAVMEAEGLSELKVLEAIPVKASESVYI